MRKWFQRSLGAMLALWLLMACVPALAQTSAMNILLIGVDSAPNGQRGRSDAMILLQVSPESRSIRLASFLRDLYVPIAGAGKTRLNAAYHYGGAELLKETLEKQFDVRIDRTVTVNFSLLCDLVDQIGGVEVEISAQELSPFNDAVLSYNADYGLSGGTLSTAGLHRLDGRQALCLSRLRKMDDDFQRTSRQQRVISAMAAQLATMSRWDLMRLALRNLSRVETDVSFSDVVSLLPVLTQFSDLSIDAVHVPFEGAYRDETVSGMMVLVPDLAKCRAKLHEFLVEN